MRPILALVAVTLLALSAAPATAQDAATTTGQSEPRYELGEPEEHHVETEHGTIYGEVIRPVTPEGDPVEDVPVILTYSPYNVIRAPINVAGSAADDAVAAFFVPRGYARAVFDVVGTRESSGCYDYGGIAERETGAAIVDHLGSQDWSNGKVGMIGGSYDGTTQLAAAVEAPEHLVAIIPQVAIDRWYDYAYGGGVRYFLNSERPTDEGFDTPFAFDFGFGFLPPDDPTQPQFGQALQDHFSPCDRLRHTEEAYVPDPVYDDFWLERDYRHLAANVEAAVFLEAGWLDHNVKHWGSTRFFTALPADHPKKLVMGQWAHSASQFEDAQDLRHAWFDHWLLGLDTGIMDLPPVDTQPNTGDRLQEADWPPPGTVDVDVPLLAEDGQRRLVLQGDSSSYTDLDVRLTEDEALAGMCGDRCLVFVSEPLPEDVRISGGPVLHPTAASDAESTHYVPVLFDEDPDGAREVISRGFLNTRNRDGLEVSEPVTPDEPYVAPVPIWDVDWILPAGHRLGVAVLSSNAAWALPDDDARATNTIDVEGASFLRLPLSRGAGALGPPPAPPAPSPPPSPAAPPPSPGGDGAPGGGTLPATGGGLALLALGALAAAVWARRSAAGPGRT